MRRVLVTGVAGFIGMHCAQRLLARGDKVIGIDSLNDYYPVKLKRDRLKQIKHRNFAFEQLDISKEKALQKAFGDRYLYAGLGTTLGVAAHPRAESGSTAANILSERDLRSYRTLLSRSDAF